MRPYPAQNKVNGLEAKEKMTVQQMKMITLAAKYHITHPQINAIKQYPYKIRSFFFF